MLDTLTSLNNRDFNARYAHTFGWLHHEKGKRLVQITSVDSGRAYFSDGGPTEYHAKMDSGVVFEFIPVDHGWFNGSDGRAYLLSRMPARQWKRGIASSNTQIQDLDYFRYHDVSLVSLGRIFNDEFSTRNYSKTLTPGALSKHFAWRKRDGAVYMYDREIGHYKDDTFVLFSDLFQQELTDLINRNGWIAKVEVTKD